MIKKYKLKQENEMKKNKIVAEFPTLPAEGFVDEKEILGDRKQGRPGVLPISRSQWVKGVKAGKYPTGVKHGRRVLYPVEAIRNLLSEILAAA